MISLLVGLVFFAAMLVCADVDVAAKSDCGTSAALQGLQTELTCRSQGSQQKSCLDGNWSSTDEASLLVISQRKEHENAHPFSIEKLPKEDLKEIEARVEQRWSNVEHLPICRIYPAICAQTSLKFQVALAAQATMRANVGGPFLGSLALMFFAAGVCINLRLGHGPPVQQVPDKRDEDLQMQTPWRPLFPRSTDFLERMWLATSQALEPMISFSQRIGKSLEPLDLWFRWWSLPPKLSQPLTTMKLFIALLLFVELFVLTSNAQAVLATPELIAIARKYPWSTKKIIPLEVKELVPPIAPLLMPGLESNVDGWVQSLLGLRQKLLISWYLFLILPNQSTSGPKAAILLQMAVAISYSVGTLIYVYFAIIGLMYYLSHTVQTMVLFLVCGVFAVPFLETNWKAGAWLRKALLLNIIIPCYLFAGIGKLRYAGFWRNVSGAWLAHTIRKAGAKNGFAPALNKWLVSQPGILGFSISWPITLMSWGNMVMELGLPVLGIMSANNGLHHTVMHFGLLIILKLVSKEGRPR